MKPLYDWLAQRGAELRSMVVVDAGSGGRGVRAAVDIREGQLLLRVPRAALITVDVAKRSSIGRRMLAADIDAPGGHSLLAAHLIAERRRPGSPIAPYLDALPSEFPTVPLFFPKELLPVLKGTLAATLMVRRRETLCRELFALRRAVAAFREVSVREFFWARTAVITRVFGVKIAGVPTEALVPMADMLNHARPPGVDWCYDDEAGAFLMRAARDLRAGEELFDSYGRKPNGRFFVHYGFALPEGADDEIEVLLSLPRGAPCLREKAAALESIGGPRGWYRLSNRLKHEDSRRTFSFLRTAVASEGETRRALDLLRKDQPVLPLSPRNEAAALALLDNACIQSLARFDSPLTTDDDALLGRVDLPLNVRNAVLVRRGEKRLLHALRRMCATAVDMLRLPRKRFFTEAVHFEGEGLTASYLFDTAMALAPREARPPSFRDAGL